MTVDVLHVPEQSRFEAEGGQAFLTYERSNGSVVFMHTVVPPDLGGRGIAGQLAAAAVDWARSEGHEVEARCSYVRGWLEKHG